MDTRTRGALESSIRKWQNIVAGRAVDLGVKNCQLCIVFHKNTDDGNCAGCPVADKVGLTGCRGTPYIVWREVSWPNGQNDDLPVNGAGYDFAQRPAALQAAQAELDFLVSLLPEKAA